ncbi:MAG TPA: formyltransferase family protein [Patescibacteria group bacterium]|nr:formyltransferase family protein [Patescibacteria group bacterium]
MIKKILVFASGDKIGGGSGFQEMVERSRTEPKILNAKIVGVVSNYPNGGVYQKAMKLGVPFTFFPKPFTAEIYRELVRNFQADFVMCSGWLKPITGLPEKMVINIHPGPLPSFGGKGMYGHHVHKAVIAAYRRGEITQSAVSIHFVNDKYDCGAGIVRVPVLIRLDDTAETLAARVLKVEHNYQSLVLNQIVNGDIRLGRGRTVYFKNKEISRFSFINE